MLLQSEKRLAAKYPRIFRDLHGNPHVSCLAFGIECGDGWYSLIDRLCADISKADPHVYVTQVKEKYGTLRFYTNPTTHAVLDRIEAAEQESASVCELCGAGGAKQHGRGWVMTRCDDCAGED